MVRAKLSNTTSEFIKRYVECLTRITEHVASIDCNCKHFKSYCATYTLRPGPSTFYFSVQASSRMFLKWWKTVFRGRDYFFECCEGSRSRSTSSAHWWWWNATPPDLFFHWSDGVFHFELHSLFRRETWVGLSNYLSDWDALLQRFAYLLNLASCLCTSAALIIISWQWFHWESI